MAKSWFRHVGRHATVMIYSTWHPQGRGVLAKLYDQRNKEAQLRLATKWRTCQRWFGCFTTEWLIHLWSTIQLGRFLRMFNSWCYQSTSLIWVSCFLRQVVSSQNCWPHEISWGSLHLKSEMTSAEFLTRNQGCGNAEAAPDPGSPGCDESEVRQRSEDESGSAEGGKRTQVMCVGCAALVVVTSVEIFGWHWWVMMSCWPSSGWRVNNGYWWLPKRMILIMNHYDELLASTGLV